MSLPGTQSGVCEKKDSRRADAALLGLGIAFFLLAGSQNDFRPLAQYGLIMLLPAVMVVTAVTGRAWIAAVSLVFLGITVRALNLDHARFGSDVLLVTREALDAVFDGKNPYGYEYAVSTNPFAYPPGNLLYYVPGFYLSDIRGTEIASAAMVLVGFAWIARLIRNDGPIVAIGLYAATPSFLALATDGSNDTSAGALLFISALTVLLAIRWSSRRLLLTSALLMGETLAFKQYTLPFWPPIVAYLATQSWTVSFDIGKAKNFNIPAWVLYAGVSLVFLAVVTLPFFIWSPSAFIHDQLAWSDVAIHPIDGWNVWAFLLRWQGWDAQRAFGDFLPVLDIDLGLATLVIGIVAGIRTPSRALLVGTAAWFAILLFARWTTFAYFAGVAPVVLLIPFADRLIERPEEASETQPTKRAHSMASSTQDWSRAPRSGSTGSP
ncbi:MAG: hypothetical protein AUI83_11255 [Armatimonadetes bacterium 13_1_40CM_3_65_7]|nr:MAG: hypothetical protein AUI83_11255 [Armatimonadetes bacterium 13_1_40CM_3_65_7]